MLWNRAIFAPAPGSQDPGIDFDPALAQKILSFKFKVLHKYFFFLTQKKGRVY